MLRDITAVAADLGLSPDDIETYGRHIAKIDPGAGAAFADRPPALNVVVTAVTPTPAGEGKTTTAIGLVQGLAHLGRRPVLAIRQPSMGPTFGIKGGGAGAGRCQVEPMHKINLHLTGDGHAVTAAHNLLAAMIDNHLHHGNALGIDPREISWRRVLDVNDRALRSVVLGLGSREDGVPRQSGFDITAASEVMVILSLATSLADLRARLGRIVVGYSVEGRPITAEDLGAAGSMAVILKDALWPNLLQTTEGVPALLHTGPFGNIATGNSSVMADLLGQRLGDVLVTEAGFAADMGLERYVNVKSRVSGVTPDAAVVVTTVRALKTHSGRFAVKAGRPLPAEMLAEDPEAVLAGAVNLRRHLDIVAGFGLPAVVAVNVFPTDHPSEIAAVRAVAAEHGIPAATTTAVVDGGAGAAELAEAVLAVTAPGGTRLTRSYELDEPLIAKIEGVARRVYGADGVDLSPAAARDLARFEMLGYGGLPVVIAKTHLSLSADPGLRGAPSGWRLPVREVRAAAGAGYVYAVCGEMRTMPGLARTPAAMRIDLDDAGEIVGLT